MTLAEQLEKMRVDWDQRAVENARHYIASGKDDWSTDEFFRSGEVTLERFVLNDMDQICQGRDPKQMTVLEIGCGAGRVTRALAHHFGEVHGVDVSGEMVQRAKDALADCENAHVYQNNGKDLSVLPDILFDFAFSIIVFQHIPSHEVVESYVAETAQKLKPGSLFKFQLQGCSTLKEDPGNTWVGVGFSEERARLMAERSNFEMRYSHGKDTQDFWLWFFRR